MLPDFHHTYALIGNGKIQDHPALIPSIKSHFCVIAVDGGLIHCDKMSIIPDMILGDLDSSPPEILQKYTEVPYRRFPIDKNETDMELAVQSIFTPEVEKITLFGALGKRSDHSLANLHLIRRY